MTLPTDEQILITREFDAPNDLVYKAWTTPELVKRWWAGRRREMTLVEIDHREVVPNERIVHTEVFEMPGSDALPEAAASLNTVTFTERDGRTTLTLLTECPTKELRDTIIESGMELGMQAQMDRLEEIAISLS